MTTTPTTASRRLAALTATLAYLVPYALSRSTTPSPDHPAVLAWYRSLRQPIFKPPDLAIPLAWLAIQTGLAWSGYRLLLSPASRHQHRALGLLAGSIFGIGYWSRLFFGRRDLALSTAASAVLGVAAGAYVLEARKVDENAALAGLPLVGWVCFATVLTAAIWRKNRFR